MTILIRVFFVFLVIYSLELVQAQGVGIENDSHLKHRMIFSKPLSDMIVIKNEFDLELIPVSNGETETEVQLGISYDGLPFLSSVAKYEIINGKRISNVNVSARCKASKDRRDQDNALLSLKKEKVNPISLHFDCESDDGQLGTIHIKVTSEPYIFADNTDGNFLFVETQYLYPGTKPIYQNSCVVYWAKNRSFHEEGYNCKTQTYLKKQ